MANPNPSKSTRFRPGMSGNPTGRPPLPENLRAINALTGVEVRLVIAKYARMNRTELEAIIQSPETPILEVSIAATFIQAARTGDCARITLLLDRTVGRPLSVDPIDAEEDLERAAYEAMPLAELIKIVKANVPELAAALP